MEPTAKSTASGAAIHSLGGYYNETNTETADTNGAAIHSLGGY